MRSGWSVKAEERDAALDQVREGLISDLRHRWFYWRSVDRGRAIVMEVHRMAARLLVRRIRAIDQVRQERAEAEHMREFWMRTALGMCRLCALKRNGCQETDDEGTCRQRAGKVPRTRTEPTP